MRNFALQVSPILCGILGYARRLSPTQASMPGEGRVIPAGLTYKIRGPAYYFRGKPVFPSYLQAGPSFYIEKSKRKMIAEDIASALKVY
jgi:hypothetical protein